LLGVTAEALRAKIDRKSTILLQRGQFDPKFQVEGVAPTNHFCTNTRIVRPMNALQLLDTCIFEPPFGGLGQHTMIILGSLESA